MRASYFGVVIFLWVFIQHSTSTTTIADRAWLTADNLKDSLFHRLILSIFGHNEESRVQIVDGTHAAFDDAVIPLYKPRVRAVFANVSISCANALMEKYLPEHESLGDVNAVIRKMKKLPNFDISSNWENQRKEYEYVQLMKLSYEVHSHDNFRRMTIVVVEVERSVSETHLAPTGLMEFVAKTFEEELGETMPNIEWAFDKKALRQFVEYGFATHSMSYRIIDYSVPSNSFINQFQTCIEELMTSFAQFNPIERFVEVYNCDEENCVVYAIPSVVVVRQNVRCSLRLIDANYQEPIRRLEVFDNSKFTVSHSNRWMLDSVGMWKVENYKSGTKNLSVTITEYDVFNHSMNITDSRKRWELVEPALASVNTPYIFRMRGLFRNKDSSKVFVLADSVDCFRDLSTFHTNNRFTNEELVMNAKRIGDSFLQLKSAGILHTCLKFDDFILDENKHIFLNDILGAKILGRKESGIVVERLSDICLMAPEVVGFEPANFETNVWSFGVLLYILYTDDKNNGPFAYELDDLEDNIRTKKPDYDLRVFKTDFGKELRNLLEHMIVVEQSQRFTIEQVLQHKWFTSNGYPFVNTKKKAAGNHSDGEATSKRRRSRRSSTARTN